MKKFSISMLLSAVMMFGALFATTTTASACGRSYSPCTVTYVEPIVVSSCGYRCEPVVTCYKKWRWKTIRVWNSRLCCYTYKRVRRYRTVCR